MDVAVLQAVETRRLEEMEDVVAVRSCGAAPGGVRLRTPTDDPPTCWAAKASG
jgi:hypothetical protein